MLRILLPVLAIALLGTSGCVAAAIVGAAGAGYGYTQAKKSGSPVKQHGSTQPAKTTQPGKETTQPANETTQPTNGTTPPTKATTLPKGVKLLPAPGEFVDCRLEDGQHFAMSAADCRAKGGTTS